MHNPRIAWSALTNSRVFVKFYILIPNVKSFGLAVQYYVGLKFGSLMLKLIFNLCKIDLNAALFEITAKYLAEWAVFLDSQTEAYTNRFL